MNGKERYIKVNKGICGNRRKSIPNEQVGIKKGIRVTRGTRRKEFDFSSESMRG